MAAEGRDSDESEELNVEDEVTFPATFSSIRARIVMGTFARRGTFVLTEGPTMKSSSARRLRGGKGATWNDLALLRLGE